MMRWLVVMLVSVQGALAIPSQRIGQALVMTDVYIPGGEARPAPRRDREPPLVVRLLDVKPAQDGFRYDFEIQGLGAGDYDLAAFLIAADPENPPRFPEIPLEITAGLPGIHLPETGKVSSPENLGGYRTRLVVIGGVWIAGLAGILVWMKKRPQAPADLETAPSLAERMKPLLDRAASGRLDADGRASLERLILGHWRSRLPGIGDKPPAIAMSDLRKHSEASALLLALETWLHAPDAEVSPGEIEHLLSSYR